MAYYDPAKYPDPDDWFRDSERERIDAVMDYHHRAGLTVANIELHARFHETVETQLANDEPVVSETLERLQDEGLDRHEAIHAIGFVLAQHTYRTVRGSRNDDAHAAYLADLPRLTAARWKKMR